VKISVKKRNLDAAIQVATLALGSGEDSNIETHYLIRHNTKTGGTSVLGHGKRLLAEAPLLECVVETDATTDYDAITVPGWRLRTWLSAITDGDEDLTIERLSDGTLKGTAKRGSGKFGSLNPKDWRYWDDTFADAKKVASIKGSHFINILTYVKSFVSDQETRSPAIVAVECRDGVLSATDSVGVAVITAPALKDSTLRVHGKDIPTLISFLGLAGDTDVELLEHDRCLFLKLADGRVFGAGRWVHQFPHLTSLDPDPSKPSKGSFRLNTADMLGAMKYLLAFAQKDDGDIHFSYGDNKVTLSMRSGSGSKEYDTQVLDCIESTGMDAIKAEGHEGFTLTKRYVESVATAFGEETMLFRVDVTKKNGYVSFFHDRDGDSYYTVIVWVKGAR
jgi:hypothetical protein